MKTLRQLLIFLLLATFILQLYFLLKVALSMTLAPQSTSFQRSEIWRTTLKNGELSWQQSWVNYSDISIHLKRAVIAAEDGDFVNHMGVEWDAVEQAWEKNSRSQAQAQKRSQQATTPSKAPKLVGGSTISQQLAKNLFLSGERTLLRKFQEFIVTHMLELLLDKTRILEIYLNSIEWGEGVFGAEAAAQHYFNKSAKRLGPHEAARLAVMLPRPKFFESRFNSPYLLNRAGTIAARMNDSELP